MTAQGERDAVHHRRSLVASETAVAAAAGERQPLAVDAQDQRFHVARRLHSRQPQAGLVTAAVERDQRRHHVGDSKGRQLEVGEGSTGIDAADEKSAAGQLDQRVAAGERQALQPAGVGVGRWFLPRAQGRRQRAGPGGVLRVQRHVQARPFAAVLVASPNAVGSGGDAGVRERRLRREPRQQYGVQLLAEGEPLRGDTGSGQVVLADVAVHGQRAVLAVEFGLHMGVEAVPAVLVHMHGLHMQGADLAALAEQQPAAYPDLVAVGDQHPGVETRLAGCSRQPPAAFRLLQPQGAVRHRQAARDETVAA